MDNWVVNSKQTSVYSEVKTKKKDREFRRVVFVLITALIGISISLAGYLTESWGKGMDYFFIFLTYQSCIMIIVYYTTRLFSFLYNKNLYYKVSKVSYHAPIASYGMFVFLLMSMFLFPYAVVSTSLEAVIEDLTNRGGIWGLFLRHGFIHAIVPLVVFYDYLKTKHNKADIEAMSKKTIAYWHIYILAYLVFIIILGATTGMYAYPIVDFEHWGWMMFAFYPPLLLIYWGLVAFLYYNKKRSIRKNPYYL